MKAIHNIAFLCGCFSVKENYPAITSVNSKWKKILKTKEEKSMMEKFYYPEFVDFCYQDENSVQGTCIERYLFPMDTEIEVDLFGKKQHTVSIKDIELFVLPYNLLIYSIRVDQNEADLNDITAALSILRNISDYKEELIQSSWGKVLEPIVEIYKSLAMTAPYASNEKFRYFNLMENGNKLKLFQIIEMDLTKVKEQDELLFELGTLAPINSYNSSSFSSPSQDYFNKIMEQNKVSVFNNWKGLSLFDTFTILSYHTQSYLLDNWINAYFGMIYIHSLFLKFYLFRMNILFRKKQAKAAHLEKEFVRFERNYCFHKISYNFLPLEIYESLDTGLEINEEKSQLYHMIEQEKNMQEKENNSKINNLLFFLACLTVFSTIWDFCCLFNQLYPYEESWGSVILGHRMVASMVLFLLVVCIILIGRFNTKK